MRKTLAVAAVGLMLLVGCKSDSGDMDSSSSGDTKKMSMTDDCSHCPEKQTAKADGTCPKCGMKLKS